MKSLSIVVVAYNNENHVQEALRSCILPQKGAQDYEVIVVYNKSDDKTLDAIRSACSKSPCLFNVVENSENFGLGEARNIGIKKASGKYIAFLDGDDFFTGSGIKKILNLSRIKNNDLIIFDYCRFYPNGKEVRNKKRHLLYEGERKKAQEKAKLFENFNAAWNKLYKNSFVNDHGLEFSKGYYEDLDWNVRSLCLAESIYVLPHVVIEYRQRAGSILRSKSEEHFDAIARHKSSLEFLKSRPDMLDKYGKSVFNQAKNQIFHVVRTWDRLPKECVPRYLDEACKLIDEYYQIFPGERKGFIEKSANLRSYWLFKIADKLKTMHGNKGKFAISYLSFKKKVKVALYREAFCRFPLKNNRVVFSSYWGKRIDCNPWYIFDNLNKESQFECVWIAEGSAIKNSSLLKGYEKCFRNNSIKALWHLATAKVIVNNANFPDYYVKREGSVYIQTKHGSPIKYMGLDIRRKDPNHMNWSKFYLRCENWDYVVSSNKYSTEKWRQAFPYSYKIVESGYPRNDCLVAKGCNKHVEEIKRTLRVPAGKKVALYAPTFRQEQSVDLINHQLDAFNAGRVKNSLGEEYVLLTRGHYLEHRDENVEAFTGIYNVDSYEETADLLLICDLLITDYSSMMFDYLVLDRPLVVYAYDYADYGNSRGLYFNLKDKCPGVYTDNFDGLLRVLENNSFAEKLYTVKRREFVNSMGFFDAGRATREISKIIKEVAG